MSASGSWRVLRIRLENAPKLLVRADFSHSGYEIEFTDLCHVWGEVVSKDDIILRASEAGSSIDPGQDNEQFKIFLGKVESAINGDNGTSLELHPADNDGTALTLHLSAKLPHPLPAFTWTLQLQLLPREDTERLLITPLLRQASVLRQQIAQLVNELVDKDRVISKICDRLETSGNDLTTVFPGVSNIKTSRKKGQREQLARHVKGLADFDEDSWKLQTPSMADGDDMDGSQMNEVLSGLPISATSCIRTNWWQRLDRRSPVHSNNDRNIENAANSRLNKSNHVSIRVEDSMPEDEFQTQNTPPHLEHRSPSGRPASQHAESTTGKENPAAADPNAGVAEGDDSTTDYEDDDLDAPLREAPPSQPSAPVPSQQKSASAPPRRIGRVGGRATESNTPGTEGVPSESSPDPKPRSKLGKIGGKGKSVEVASPAPEADDDSRTGGAKSMKMGVIGGKRSRGESAPQEDGKQEAPSPQPPAQEEERYSRAVTKAESPPPPREDSQERADRKRDQLRRELEEKAKAPAKKKRKF